MASVSPPSLPSASPSLYLIDVSALAYRSFFAFIRNPLINSKGEETSAVFGFVSAILRLIHDRKPEYIAFVKDLKGPTWRHEAYAEYKAHRKPMPDGLAAQLPIIDDFVAQCGLRAVSLPGYEADDVMATLAIQARARAIDTYLVTRDKDLMQLIGPHVFLFEPGKQGQDAVVVGPDEVKAKWGVGPEHIVDFLSLLGDASDNVPGVQGIGEKGAASLLQQFGSLDGIYDRLGEITRAKLKENLERDRENAFLSRRLVTLHTELTLDLGLDDLRYSGLDVAKVKAFLARYEMPTLGKTLPSEGSAGDTGEKNGAPDKAGASAGESEAVVSGEGGTSVQARPQLNQPSQPVNPQQNLQESLQGSLQGSLFGAAANPHPHTYVLVDSEEGLIAMVADLARHKVLAVDTETTSLNTREAELVGLCLSAEPHHGYYVTVGHAEGQNAPLTALQKHVKPLFDDATRTLVLHNAKYDLPVLANHGLLPDHLDKPGHLADTLVAAYLGNPGERGLSLDDLAMRYFGHAMIPIEDLIGKGGKGKPQLSFAQVSRDLACEYGAEDADYTLQLWQVLEKDLRDKKLLDLYFNLEMALTPVLMQVEQKGVLLDVKGLKALGKQLNDNLFGLEKKIFELVGHTFNLGSTQQLGTVLFDELKLKHGRKTKTGYSTDADTLEKLVDEHEIIPLLLEYRELSKLRSTYVESLPHEVDARTGRVHTTFSQTIAATGRLSSINPNLQNIPVRTEAGRAIRTCFIAPPGRKLLVADYSQIELRLLAHFSGDPALVDAYRHGHDIHTRTAAAIYGLAESEVTGDMRRNAKTVNFGVLYGMGPQRLSQQLKIPMAEAKRFIENYFKTYARVDAWITETIAAARNHGYVETFMGRRRYLPELAGDNRMLRENAERIAVNTPIQGTAADLIKVAMIHIAERLKREQLPCDMILQVHDELVFEVDDSAIEAASALVKHEMIHALEFSVPLDVGLGVGTDWIHAKE
jgi:DNA polymerase I